MGGAASRQIRGVSDELLLATALEAAHMRDLLQRLGLAAYGGNYESIRARLDRLGALDARFGPQPRRTTSGMAEPTPEQLSQALADARSVAAVLRSLGWPESASSYRRLRRRLATDGIDVPKYPGQSWRAGRTDLARIPIEQMLVLGGRTTAGHLKLRLLRDGVLEPCCAMCGIREWRGQPAPLELDHVNGNRRDNRLENLRLLCPNCHAQTPTYRGRNIGRTGVAE